MSESQAAQDNTLLLEMGTAIAEQYEEDFDWMVPRWVTSGLREKPNADRLAEYAHEPTPENPGGTYPSDVATILDPQGLEKMRMGVLPIVESPDWRALLEIWPTVYTFYADDFRQLWREATKKLDEEIGAKQGVKALETEA